MVLIAHTEILVNLFSAEFLASTNAADYFFPVPDLRVKDNECAPNDKHPNTKDLPQSRREPIVQG